MTSATAIAELRTSAKCWHCLGVFPGPAALWQHQQGCEVRREFLQMVSLYQSTHETEET